MIENFKNKAVEIINTSIQLMNNANCENFGVIKIIYNEFNEILRSIENDNQIIVLNNKRLLWSTRTIIDSANFDYDVEFFDLIREFQKMCENVNEKFILIKKIV